MLFGGDSIYGNSPELRAGLQELGKAFVMDVGEEFGGLCGKAAPICDGQVIGSSANLILLANSNF